MSDCTCVRGDDGQVKVPRSRCPQHGWVDIPTTAPAFTDEQMGSSPSDDAQIDDDVRALVEGESMPEETAWAIIAAVIARAKREERARISDELNAWAETHRPTSPYTEGRRDAAYRAVDVARQEPTQ